MRLDSAERGGFIGFRDFRFLHFAIEIGIYGSECAIEKALLDIAEDHAITRARKNVRDSIAHRTRAENGDGFDLSDAH